MHSDNFHTCDVMGGLMTIPCHEALCPDGYCTGADDPDPDWGAAI